MQRASVLLGIVILAIGSSGCSSGTARAEKVAVINASAPGMELDITRHLVPGVVTVFDFYSESCPPCRALSPLLERMAASRDDIVVRKIDINRPGAPGIDFGSPVARQYGLQGVPHVVAYTPTGAKYVIGDPFAFATRVLVPSGGTAAPIFAAADLVELTATKPSFHGPALLAVGEPLLVVFDYRLVSADTAVISIQPYTNGAPTPGFATVNSPPLPRGEDQVQMTLSFHQPAVVDELRVSVGGREALARPFAASWVAALPPAPAAESAIAEVYAAMKLTPLEIVGAPGVPGTILATRVGLHNASGRTLRVPLHRAANPPYPLIGAARAWLERLGPDPAIPSIPDQVGRQGNRYAMGQGLLPVSGDGLVRPNQSLLLNPRINTEGFPPGSYRYTIEYLDVSASAVLQSVSVDFEVAP